MKLYDWNGERQVSRNPSHASKHVILSSPDLFRVNLISITNELNNKFLVEIRQNNLMLGLHLRVIIKRERYDTRVWSVGRTIN